VPSENANDSLKGRIVELSVGELNKDEENAFRKVKLRVDEIQGKKCLTNFHGMEFTSDKLVPLRKWQTLIEAHVDVKTTDGYLVRCSASRSRSDARTRSRRHLRAGESDQGHQEEDVRGYDQGSDEFVI